MLSITGARKRGRPAVGATSVNVRLPPAELAALDKHILELDQNISRPEAIRRILAEKLDSTQGNTVNKHPSQ
jgi:hypothetical protein